jgi:Secretion system C-terminal sorting domain
MMKKIILLICVASSIFFNHSYSWDTTAAKYMPLQVGNVWVYYTYNQVFPMHGTGYSKYKITGINESGGKKYYQVQQTYYHISGTPPGCGIPFFNNLRIDSLTMNLYQIGGGCINGDRMLDSLKAKKDDTAWTCPPSSSFSRCTDTNTVNIFGSSFKVKKFNDTGRGNLTVFAMGIGITNWGFAELNTLCVDTLKGCVIGGVLYGDTSTLVGITQISSEVPEEYSLSQNYPNPFNPMSKLKFQMPKSGFAVLKVFDVLGKEIQVLVNQELSPGTYVVDFDGSNLPSGIYYYKFEAEGFTQTRKMVLVK